MGSRELQFETPKKQKGDNIYFAGSPLKEKSRTDIVKVSPMFHALPEFLS
jgi:hypothetical protein